MAGDLYTRKDTNRDMQIFSNNKLFNYIFFNYLPNAEVTNSLNGIEIDVHNKLHNEECHCLNDGCNA